MASPDLTRRAFLFAAAAAGVALFPAPLARGGGKGNPNNGNPNNGNPNNGNATDGNPNNGNATDGNPSNGNANNGNPGDGNSNNGNGNNGNGNNGNNGGGRTNNGKVQGAFKAHVRGVLTGDGNAVVSAKSVQINCDVTDENGKQGKLSAKLVLVDGRFKGTGDFNGARVNLSGRIEPPDQKLRTARLVCTFAIVGGGNGRIVAVR